MFGGGVTLNGNEIQPKMTAGDGIKIENNVVSGISLKLLWENVNPDERITTTTITLASDDYDFLIFAVRGHLSTVPQTYLVKKGMSFQSYFINNSGYYNTDGDSILSLSRTFTYVDDKTYSVSTTSVRNWLSQSTAINRSGFNDAQIPLYVLGVKL